MSRPATVHEKRRLTLEFTAAVRERMDELREKTGAESVTEVIRRALAFYDVVLSFGDSREIRLVAKDKHGNEETVLIPRGAI